VVLTVKQLGRAIVHRTLGLIRVPWVELERDAYGQVRAAALHAERGEPSPAVFIRGDAKTPPTIPLIRWFQMRHWSQVVLTVDEAADHVCWQSGFLIGFIDTFGNVYVRERPIRAKKFRVRLGHEDVIFFALQGGRLLQLKRVGVFPPDGANFITRRDLNAIPLY